MCLLNHQKINQALLRFLSNAGSNRLLGFTKNLNHRTDGNKLGTFLYAPSGASLNGFLNTGPMEKFNQYLLRITWI